MEYILFFLTYGQKAPIGSTGVMLSNGGIMWVGEDGTFPASADLGTKLDSDPSFDTEYNNRLASVEEIEEYEHIVENPIPPEE
jgi:hypothetical protein